MDEKHPNISHVDPTPSILCRVFGLTSEEGKKKNGSIGYVNVSKKFGFGVDLRHPVCLDGFKGPISIKASNLEMYPDEDVLKGTVQVGIGRQTFFDTRFVAVFHNDSQSMGQTPVMNGKTARTAGNLEAMDILVRKHMRFLGQGIILVNLTDLNLARAFNRAALGEEVKLAPPLYKKFQRIKRMLPKDGKQKVMIKYFPNRLWPDKFLSKMEKLGTQRYEAAKLGTYQIYPSSHEENLDALEVFYADGSGKRKDVTIQHELYQDYGVEETTLYVRNVVAMEETHRLFPEVLAGVDPHAFWAAILWLRPFMTTMEKMQVPNNLLDEWKLLEVGKGKSLKHFRKSMELYRFHPSLSRGPNENWGISTNKNEHFRIATDFTICAIEAVRKSLLVVKGISSTTILTRGQFKGTEMWRYIRGTTMFKEFKKKHERETGEKMSKQTSIMLYQESMKSLGFGGDSKYWVPSFETQAQPPS